MSTSRGGGASCDHCGLPVPAALIAEGAERQFCCQGCRFVYEAIHEQGLERFYELRDESEADSPPARTTDRSYREFDDPAFRQRYCRDLASGERYTELYLEGVHCAACVWLVERVPVVSQGVVEVRLEVGRARATVRWDPEKVELSAVARLLDSLGYPPHPYRRAAARDLARREDRAMLVRIGVAGAVAGNVMLIAFALYGGMFHGMEREYSTLFRWSSLLLSLPAVLWCANVFYRGAWAALRTRALHMDLPISLGILAGSAWGAWNTIRGAGEIYFDSVTVLVFLLLVGRLIQRRQQRAASDSAELLFSLTPTSARRVEKGEVQEVPLEALAPGDLVEARAGDAVPADGVVEEGRSSLDLSLLTGESRPVAIEEGGRVHAGTTNLASRLLVRVESTGEDTRVGRLMRMVEEASRRRAPVVALADRISGWFVLGVLILAAVTVAIWLRLDPAHAVDHAVALLIVTCPCALGLATPLAVSAAIGQASRVGILVKGGDVLEALARPGRMWLDKTGTLTEGRTALRSWWGEEEVRPLVAAVEAHSSHPIALGFAEALGPAPEELHAEILQTTGGGLEGRVGEREVTVGSPLFVERAAGGLPAGARGEVERLTASGLSPVAVAVDGRVAAVAGFGDELRPDAAATLARIRRSGWKVGILSGDHPEVVAAVAERLALAESDCRGGVLPEQKLEVVREEEGRRTVAMVGDGVNDAAALAAATVGIGVHGGAEAALAAADVFLARPGTRPVARLLEGSRRTMGVIRRNLLLSLVYNLAGASLAMAGLISPLLAAILMPASSLTVITSSYRARTFGQAGRSEP
jgi:Cu2+-exporting ATPase